jgi:Tfp pilus assembly protein FimV
MSIRFAALLFFLLSLPALVGAASLGELRVSSKWGEPLKARVELDLAPGERLEQISLQISVQGAHSAGRLESRIQASPDGTATIIVRSPDPVEEDSLAILVEAESPLGRASRSYAVGFVRGESASVVAAPVAQVGPQVQALAPARAPAAPTVAPAPAQPTGIDFASMRASPAPAARPGTPYATESNAQAEPGRSAEGPPSRPKPRRPPAQDPEPAPPIVLPAEPAADPPWTGAEKVAVGAALTLLALSLVAIARYL